MRKLILKVSKKLRLRFSSVYTWIYRSSFESIGKDSRIDFPNRFEHPESISIGRGVVMYSGSWYNAVNDWAGQQYDGKIKIGDNAMFGYGVQISAASSIVIEDGVTVAGGVVIMDHIHEYRDPNANAFTGPLSEPQPVHIGKSAFLGVYCFIGPGVKIGEHAVVSANAVVTKDVPAYCVAVGNPARTIRFHDPLGTSTAQLSTVQG